MNWRSQVLHVARKDVRALRWPIAAYAVVVAACTAMSAGAVSLDSSGFALAGWYDVLAFLVLAGALVHEDSPTSVRAFWATRPISPSAVLGAKALVAVVVLGGMAFVGQLIDVIAYRVPANAVVGTLAPTLQLVLVITAFPLLLATVSPGMPVFVGLLLVAILGDGVGVSALISAGEGLTGTKALLVTGVYIAIAIGIFGVALLVYRSHDAKRAQWVTLVLAAAPFVAGMVPVQYLVRAESDPRDGATRGERGMPARPIVARPTVRVAGTSDGVGPGRSYLSVATRVDSAPAPYRYVFRATSARMIRNDGSTKPLVLDQYSDGGDCGGCLGRWVDRSVVWLGSPTLVDASSVDVEVTAAERDAFHRGAWRLAIDGLVDVREPHRWVEMPIDTSGSITKDGLRVAIDFTTWPRGPLVRTRESIVSARVLALRSSSVGISIAVANLAMGPASVSLRNERRHEGIRLTEGGGGYYPGNVYFPIPSVAALVSVRGYHAADLEGRPGWAGVGPAWMKDARLRFDQWVLVGDYRASIVADAVRDTIGRAR